MKPEISKGFLSLGTFSFHQRRVVFCARPPVNYGICHWKTIAQNKFMLINFFAIYFLIHYFLDVRVSSYVIILLSLLFEIDLVYPRLALNLLSSHRWLWTPITSFSPSWILGWQACTNTLHLNGAWDRTQDFVHVKQALYNRHIPTLSPVNCDTSELTVLCIKT